VKKIENKRAVVVIGEVKDNKIDEAGRQLIYFKDEEEVMKVVSTDAMQEKRLLPSDLIGRSIKIVGYYAGSIPDLSGNQKILLINATQIMLSPKNSKRIITYY
jgi:hypothetical protein